VKSKAFYSNFYSLPLALENMKRFWTIGAVGFLIYFLSGIFPLLMSYDRISNYMVSGMLSNQNPGYMAAHLFLSIASAVAVFRYLQTTGSVSVMHSMPFSRKMLYLSSYGSGLKLACLPSLVNTLILLLLKTPVYQSAMDGGLAVDIDVFTTSAVLNWMLETWVIIVFVYTIAVFAGMVTGTVVMHTLTAIGFNFLLTALYLTFLGYSEMYFFGYAHSSSITEIALKLSPYTYVFEHGGNFGAKAGAGYIAAATAIAAGTFLIYKKRPLERAGDSTVFKFMEYFISFLVVFFGSSLVGMIFFGNDYGYGGFALGGVLGFLVGQMIVKKTMKIFNFGSLRAFILFAAIMSFLIVGFNTDLFGYERRVPAAETVKSAGINCYDLSEGQPVSYFSEAENILHVLDFHQSVADNRKEYSSFEGEGISISIDYELTSGNQMTRQYLLPYSAILESLELQMLYESLEADAGAALIKDLDSATTQIDIYSSGGSSGNTLTLHYSDDADLNLRKEGLLAALALDISGMSFQERCDSSVSILQLEVAQRTEVTQEEMTESGQTYYYESGPVNYKYSTFSFSITRNYEYTLMWLLNNGYSDALQWVGEKDFAVVTADCAQDQDLLPIDQVAVSEEQKKYMSYPGAYAQFIEIPLSKKGTLVVTNRELLSTLLRDYAARDMRFIRPGDALCLTIYAWYGYEDNNYYESYNFYYLDKSNLPEGISAEVQSYL
jgi:ABC-2 type transport system permease protein